MENKSVVGIDIAKDKFDICLKTRKQDGRIAIKGSTKFENTGEGITRFMEWVNKRVKDTSCLFVMEATGVYYEDLAYFLYEQKQKVCVVLANTVKHYAKSMNVKTKTDKVDAGVLASMGMERELGAWQPMSPQYKNLRDLNRLRMAYKKDLVRSKSQLHAMQSSHHKLEVVVSIHKDQISFYEKTIGKLGKQIEKELDKDKTLLERIEKVSTAKGVGMDTVVSIICETNGFELFHNMRQVVSYAGLDVKFNESGSYRGKTSISKKGNARIRQALYMPALCAIQHNKPIKSLYERVCEKNPTVKQKGVVASMRKLLLLIYTLWKKNEAYDENYQWGNRNK
jgi:transposase